MSPLITKDLGAHTDFWSNNQIIRKLINASEIGIPVVDQTRRYLFCLLSY